MQYFIDTHARSLNRYGEELCGDQVRILKNNGKTRIILSDGLGSGVKANIVATMTSEILSTMLRENVNLDEVVNTIIKTLPECKVRHLAYATFTIIEVDERTYDFQVINFDNPPVFYFRDYEIKLLDKHIEVISGKRIHFSSGRLEEGDFLAAISDGLWYAGKGLRHNPQWDWEHISAYISDILNGHIRLAETVVNDVTEHTASLYEQQPSDDATIAGLYVRRPYRAMVFTGPPEDPEDDETCTQRLLSFEGRRIVCGGTTGKIVARVSGEELQTILSSIEEDVPPTARLKGVHLVTEGILTLTRTIEVIEAAQGDLTLLPDGNNGAVMLALELLASDQITFLVGQKINPFYKHPIFPTNISIRKHLIEHLAEQLVALQKEVTIEFI